MAARSPSPSWSCKASANTISFRCCRARFTKDAQGQAGVAEPASSRSVVIAREQLGRHIFHQQRADNPQKAKWGSLAVHPLKWETTMATQVKPIPEGYNTVTPYLVVDGAEKVI